MFEVLFADVIFQYSFDSSVSVWYFDVVECFLMVRISTFEFFVVRIFLYSD